jgi:hypothetical protein
MKPVRARSILASSAVALLVGLVACSSDGSHGGTSGAAGAAGAAGRGGAGGASGTAGEAGGSGSGGGAGAGGSTGVAGAAGGAAGGCQNAAATGGTGGVAAGCDLAAARQALAALGIGTVGDPMTFEMTLPPTLTDAQWSVKSDICRQGGYDLSPVAGMTICFVSQVASGTCQGYPARVYVLMSNGAVQCVYRALCAGSRITPGVYSSVDPLCVP